MFFSINRNFSEKELQQDKLVLAEIDLSKKALESPDFDELYEFDSLIDGWGSSKITIQGTHSFDSENNLVLHSGSSITFNSTNLYHYINILFVNATNYSNLSQDLPGGKFYYGTSYVNPYFVVCSDTISSSGTGLTIRRIWTLKDFVGTLERTFTDASNQSEFLRKGLFSQASMDNEGYTYSRNIIKRNSKNQFIVGNSNVGGVFRLNHYRYFHYFISRYAIKFYLKEIIYAPVNVNYYNDFLKFNDFQFPFLEDIFIEGLSGTLEVKSSHKVPSLNIHIQESISGYNDAILKIETEKSVNLISYLGTQNSYKEFWLENSTYKSSSFTPFFNNVNLVDLLHNNLEQIDLYVGFGDINFNNISGFNFTNLKIRLSPCQIHGTDIDFSNQEIGGLEFINTSGTYEPYTTYPGTITFKQIEDYEIFFFQKIGRCKNYGVTLGRYYSYGVILPLSIKLVDRLGFSSYISKFILQQIYYLPETPDTIVPHIKLFALKFSIRIYLGTTSHGQTISINKISFEDILYSQMDITIQFPSTTDSSQFYLEGLIYARNAGLSIANSSYHTFQFICYGQPIPTLFKNDLKKICTYFKTVQLKITATDFDFEDDLVFENITERLSLFIYNDINYFPKITFPTLNKLTFLNIHDLSGIFEWDFSKVNVRSIDDNTFSSSNRWFFYYLGSGSLNNRYLIRTILPEVQLGKENNHTCGRLYLCKYQLDFHTFKLGEKLIAQTIYLPTGGYQYIEFIKQIYDNYQNFKPRPNDPLQDTSDYAKTISTLTYGTTIRISNFIGTGGQLPKPLGYIQADSLNAGNDGQVVYPKDQIVTGGDLTITSGTTGTKLNFDLIEYDTPISLEVNLTFSGNLSGENTSDYMVFVREKYDRILKSTSTTLWGRNKELFYGGRITYGDIYSIFIFSGFNENKALFNFLPKGEYIIHIIKFVRGNNLGDGTTYYEHDSIYSKEYNLTSNQIINLDLSDEMLELDFEFKLFIDSIENTNRSIVEMRVNGVVYNSNLNSNIQPLKYIPNENNEIELTIRFLPGLGFSSAFIKRTINLTFTNETSYQHIENINSIDLIEVQIPLSPIGLDPIITSLELSDIGIQNNTSIGLELNSVWKTAYSSRHYSSKSCFGLKNFQVTAPMTLSFQYQAYPQISTYIDKEIRFREGIFKSFVQQASFNIYAMEDLGSGDEEVFFFDPMRPCKNAFDKTFTKFAFKSNLAYKVYMMYYQYCYILSNQKKDFTETLKYRWSIT